VPTGTANDGARVLGLPSEPEPAVELAAAASTDVQAVDLGEFDGHAFVNVASLGASERASSHAAPLKRWLGPVAYPVGAMLGAVRARPMRIDVTVDGARWWHGR